MATHSKYVLYIYNHKIWLQRLPEKNFGCLSILFVISPFLQLFEGSLLLATIPQFTYPNMARNEEKAQSILNRWLSQQRPDTQNQRRPAVTSECKSLGEAERWRMQLLKEIGNKVMYIQNGKIAQ